MTERMWAPWRMQYVTGGVKKSGGCFFCEAFKDAGNEREHLLLKRGELAFIMMNRFPYNVGHLMIAPARHIGNFEEVRPDEAAEMWQLVAAAKMAMQKTMRPDGFNIGINQGKCAGAGVLDHLHIHLVPRWNGDTNFMPVFGECRVMSQWLEDNYDQLKDGFC
ncbi:HIT family hydrolase [Planctomycetales bacterium]|nr:HIT family hydrolase [Planctomycetales bacterium]GHS98773.1 HIT family hydrolase [Planctomycetales bacterium]GHT06538.1 HIT family hydrolase [Planctomycetales bacterium]